MGKRKSLLLCQLPLALIAMFPEKGHNAHIYLTNSWACVKVIVSFGSENMSTRIVIVNYIKGCINSVNSRHTFYNNVKKQKNELF